MRREYTAGEFEELADYLLAAVPGLTLASDVICG
jgi:tRNA A37 methylthiotransferase MiaB